MGAAPLRRRYARELGLGLALALGAAWFVLGAEAERPTEARGPDPGVGGAPRGEGEARSALHPAEPVLAGASDERTPGERREEAQAAVREARDFEPSADVATEFLDVLVLGARGAPAAAVPLQLVARETRDPRAPEHLTGADGRVRIPLAPRLGVPAASDLAYALRVALPLSPAPRIELGPPPLRSQELTLRLPPAGRLRVEVRDARGAPVRTGASVSLWGGQLAGLSAPVLEGWADFPWLELGLALKLRAFFHDQRGGAVEEEWTGPLRDGELVEAHLTLGQEWPLLAWRVAEPGGRPLADLELELCVEQEPLSPQRARARSDAEGRVELRLLGTHRPVYPRTLTIVSRAPRLREGRVALTRELERDGPTDLGMLELPECAPVLLAAGWVRDEYGPVPAADVRLEPAGGSASWRSHTTTDAEGAFTFDGLAARGPLVLRVYSSAHVPAPARSVAPGAKGLVVALTRAAFLELELLTDEDLPADLALLAHDGLDAHDCGVSGRTPLPPGRYDLEVHEINGLPLARVAGVAVTLEGSADPRLHPLDLRGRLQCASFALNSADGRSLAWTSVHVRVDGLGEGWAQSREGGMLTLVLPREVSTLELGPAGCRAQRVTLGADHQPLQFVWLEDG